MFDVYSNDGDKIRYVLGCDGERTLVVIGINPSTATAEKFDHTISRVNGFLKKYNFDSFKMINIYPFRSTKPDMLPMMLDSNIHKQNLIEIKKALHGAEVILCAWGDLIFKRTYLIQCLNDIADIVETKHIPTYCLGLTMAGNPRHPLSRTKTPECMMKFEIKKYIKEIVKGDIR